MIHYFLFYEDIEKGGVIIEIWCINDKNLEDVSGGFTYSVGSVIHSIKLYQKEFDELKKANIIGWDNNLYYRDARKAFEYLEEKGYEGKININFNDPGSEDESKCLEENKPINLKVVFK